MGSVKAALYLQGCVRHADVPWTMLYHKCVELAEVFMRDLGRWLKMKSWADGR